ncbi:MAG: HAD family hydrolase [Candidatus Paceibacterota bacterium]|jgi:phosphoglycolate phosphatase-like HAD superfamily hydrolase
MSKIKLAIFDVDGVVIDSFSGIVAATNKTLKRFGGQEISEEEFRNTQIGSYELFMFSRGIPATVNWQEISDDLDGHLNEPEIYKERPGIRAVFDFLKEKGIAIYLVSAVNKRVTTNKINYQEGLADYITDTFGGEEKGEIIGKLLTDLNISPAEALFVSDMERDFIHVNPLGLAHNIAIVSQFSAVERLRPEADHLVFDHQELLSLLQNILT